MTKSTRENRSTNLLVETTLGPGVVRVPSDRVFENIVHSDAHTTEDPSDERVLRVSPTHTRERFVPTKGARRRRVLILQGPRGLRDLTRPGTLPGP